MAKIPAMSGGGNSGGTWTDIKKSGISGTVQHKELGNGLYAIHIDVPTGTGIVNDYKEIGTIPSGAYNTSNNSFLLAMNRQLYQIALKIDTNGVLSMYVASGISDTGCVSDVIYTV